MLLKNILAYQLASVAAASPFAARSLLAERGGASWELEGFAKDNPLGETTGGAGGDEVTVTTAEELVAAATSEGPAIIYIEGDISLSRRLAIASQKTIIGVGKTAHIHEFGFDVKDADNVIIRNIKISSIEGNDCMTLQNATRVWVDHNEFSSDISQGPDYFVRLTPYCVGPRISAY